MQGNFRSSLERVLKRFHRLLAVVLFLLGLVLRLLAINKSDLIWQFIADFGTFLAGTIAISFIYEIFIKTEERQLFINDLENVIETKITNREPDKRFVRIHELGRITTQQKVEFLQGATKEIIEVGTALNTFASEFIQRSSHEFKEQIVDLLRNGVNFRCASLDPASEIAKYYAADRLEHNLVAKIETARQILSGLSKEFEEAGLKGKFEVYSYAHFPYCFVVLVDPTEYNGRALVGLYMHATSRADSPILEIYKAQNPELFAKFHKMVESILVNSKVDPNVKTVSG